MYSNIIEEDRDLKTIYAKKFGELMLLEDEHILICRLKKPYVPIEKFKKIFNKAGKYIKEYNIKKFIFDKRELRAFHQPSMEWYFVEWKKDMLALGLREHRKILPEGEDWFADAVAAGRKKIESDYPDNIVDELNIVYCDSVEEAINT